MMLIQQNPALHILTIARLEDAITVYRIAHSFTTQIPIAWKLSRSCFFRQFEGQGKKASSCLAADMQPSPGAEMTP
jgi:hypothetical protein